MAEQFEIRPMGKEDFDAFWPVFQAIVQAQETYAFDPKLNRHQGYNLWVEQPLKTFCLEINGDIAASYYLKANGMGPGSHVCNCGYMVNPAYRGRGLARLLCEHSQETGKTLGFQGMQFNSVVSSNEVAVALWQKLGFSIVGTTPKGYHHKTLGLVDTHIMHKFL